MTSTSTPQLYLRRCNGHPDEGMLATRAAVEDYVAHLHRSGAIQTSGDLDTGVSMLAPGRRPWEVELPGTAPRTYTFEPLPAGQYRAPADPA